jgi:hypothetical protein
VKPEIRFNTEVTEDAEKTGLAGDRGRPSGWHPGVFVYSGELLEGKGDGLCFCTQMVCTGSVEVYEPVGRLAGWEKASGIEKRW